LLAVCIYSTYHFSNSMQISCIFVFNLSLTIPIFINSLKGDNTEAKTEALCYGGTFSMAILYKS